MHMLNLSCLCGQVRIELQRPPEFIHECNCTLCSKTGARWGYFHHSEVAVAGGTTAYSRGHKEDPNAEVHFCPTCGSTTHFLLTATAIAKHGNSMMGVNMWLADPKDLAGIELCFPDAQAWAGEGDFTYIRQTLVIGDPITFR